MKETTIFLLCAVTLAQAVQSQLALNGKVCICSEASSVCARDGSDNELIVHKNCNQFYKCSNGKAYPYTCPPTTLYNPLAEICDWPHNVDCGDRPIIDIDEVAEEDCDEDKSNENTGGTESNNGDDSSNNANIGGTCNCNPGEAPSICAADGSEGFLVAHENCNQFYKCAHGVPITQNCPSELLYNPYTEQCDWAHNVECGDRPIIEIEGGNGGGDNGGEDNDSGGNGGGTCNCNPGEAPSICAANGSEGVLVAHENCKQFYKCAHGVPVTQNCPSGLLYNPHTEQCDWAYNVECGDRPIIEIEGGDNGGGNGDNDGGSGNGDNGSGGNGGGTCNCNPGEAPGICAADGSEGVLVAHENCNQFYKCAHGVPVTQNCPSGLMYNPYTEQCDWAQNVECGDRPIIEIEGGNGGGDNGGGNGDNDGGSGNGDNGSGGNGGGTCNCNPGEAPGICAADGSEGVLVAHENCNQFYKCAHGVPVTQNCPSGLMYNPYTEQCDWAHNVECGDKPIIEIEEGGNNGGDEDCEDSDNEGGGSGSGSGNGDSGGAGNGNGTCNCNPGEAPSICAADGSEGVLVAHENCNQFYKCAHGVPVTQNCPSGLLYNPHTEQCDWAYNVECGDRPIIEIEGGDNGGGNGDNDGGSGNGDSGSGGNGGGTCNCNPGEAPSICAADGSEGVLVAHENCNQFYKCAHGVPVTQNCPSGLLYNPYTEQCDWAQNVECGDRPIIEIEGGNGGGDNGGGNGDNDGGSGNGDNGSGGNGGGTCNCNPGEAPGICAADGSEGVLVAHENCNQFYKCAHGVPVTQNCPSGLMYNPYTEQCDWAHNVECGDKPIIEIEEGGNNGGDEDCEDSDNEGGGSGSGSGNGDSGGAGNGNGTCNCNPGEAPSICAADGSEGVLVAHENCNQFYKCAHGVPVTQNCPSGLLYNPHTEQCDWAYNVECGDRPIIEIEGGDNGGGNGDNDGGSGNGDSGSGGNGGGTCNCNPGEAPSICAADGSEGVLVAHENCNQFYKCAHGVPVTQNCPSGLLYNPYTEQCDWAQNVECGDRPIIEIEGGNGGGDNGGGNGDNDGGSGNGDNGSGGNGGGTCNCNPGEAPGICAADGSEGVLVAHENCNQFYKCAHGVPVTQNCPSGLMYNPYTEQCDWAHNVECGDKPIIEIEEGGNNGGDEDCEDSDNEGGGSGSGSGNGDSGGAGNGNGTCNCNPGEAPSMCAADGSEGLLVAHENCNQFYKCAHGVPVTINCPPGLLYNPYIECCDWPYNVDCGNKPIVEIDNGGNGGGDNGSGDNGTGDNGTGGGSGGNENVNSNEDNGSNGGTCNCNPGEAPGICAADGSDGTLVAHENCNQFYKCAHGMPVTVSCPPGLVFNPYIDCCDWPYNVDCGDKPIIEIDNGGNGGGDNGSGNGDNGSGNGDNGSGSGNGDNGNGDNGGTCNCNPGEAPGICALDGSDGTLVAHENCNQFYQCAYGVPVTMNCNKGLLYNPYTEQCDWPYNVKCGDRPIIEIEGGNGGSDNGGGNGDNDGGSGNGDNGSGGNGGGTCNCNPSEAPSMCAADGSEGILVAHENCNQFYKCAHGVPVTVNCPPGLLYNPYIECCDWPYNVDCGDKPIVEIDNGGNGGGDNGSGDNGTGDNGTGGGSGSNENANSNEDNGSNGGTCNCNPGEAPGICAADGSDGTLVAHENCNQFYKCAHGMPVTVSCPPGLVFNPYIDCCDWPYNVDCGNKPIIEIDNGGNGGGDNGSGNGDNGSGNGDNGSGSGNGDNGNGDNGGTCNCNPGEAPEICGLDGSDGTLVAHENCNQFYQCAYGVPVTMNCNKGLLYNPYTEQCDWPYNVECGDRPIIEIEGGNGGGDNDGGNGDNDGGSGNGDNGSGGNGGGTCNCNPGEAPGICAADGSEGVLVAHENCNQFYKCAHGIPVTLNCNNDLLYNPYTEQCDWPYNVDCGDRPIIDIDDNNTGDGNGNGDNGSGGGNDTCNCNPGEAPGICAANDSDGVLVAHENCNQFYKCSRGLPVALSCPGNLLYNPMLQVCDWPENVDCGDRTIPDSAEEDNNGDDNLEGENGNNGGNCDPSEAPAICNAAGSDGVLVAHEQCNKFYKCSFGSPVALKCYGTLLYNSVLGVCDWPENVDCGDRTIPDSVEEDNSNGSDNGGDNNGGDNGDGQSNNGGNSDPSLAPTICGNSGSNGVLVAHEQCDKFYVCSDGKPVVLDCPSNLLYNPAVEQCDWPGNVDCGDRVVPEPESGGEVEGGCSCNPRQAPSICAGSDSNGKLVAHENCNQYYVCFERTPIARSCPQSLFFEPHTEQCLWPASVSCEGRAITTYSSLNKHTNARRGLF